MKDYSKDIETERLLLRKFKLDDCEDVFNNYASHEPVTEFMTWHAHKTHNDTIDFLNIVLPEYNEEYNYRWAIVLKQTNQVIGSIHVVRKDIKNLSAELGYVLGDEYWGQGIMPEAGRAIVKYLFEEGFVRICALHHVKNLKSGRVMQKIGMIHEGTLKKVARDKFGNFVDCEIYAITKD